MKKIKFKYFCGLFVLGLFLGVLPTTVSAKELELQVTQIEKSEFLKSIGTPLEALEKFNPQQIDNLYSALCDKEAYFSGFSSEIIEVKENNPNSKGNISTSQLELTVATYDMVSSGIVTGVDVSIGYNWLKDPMIHLTDALTFSWDRDLFYDDGFYATADCILDGVYINLQNIKAPALANEGSMGWYSSISPPQAGPADLYFGGAQVLLRPKKTFNSSTDLNSKMYLNYAHQILGIEISFGFSGTGVDASVSFSGGNYDKQAFSYTYH